MNNNEEKSKSFDLQLFGDWLGGNDVSLIDA